MSQTKRTQTKRTHTKRAACLLLSIAAAACSVTPRPTAPETGPSAQQCVSAIVDRLVCIAELRADLRSLRVFIDEFRPDPLESSTRVVSDRARRDRIRHALEREFLLVLANRLYVVETEPASVLDSVYADPDAPIVPHGPTHLLVGDYVDRGEDVVLSVRLVDANTGVILAATRGSVPVSTLTAPPIAGAARNVSNVTTTSPTFRVANPDDVEPAPEVVVQRGEELAGAFRDDG